MKHNALSYAQPPRVVGWIYRFFFNALDNKNKPVVFAAVSCSEVLKAIGFLPGVAHSPSESQQCSYE
jgi:hypothetical protein